MMTLYRRIALLLLALAALLLVPRAAMAQAENLKIEASAGYGGYYRPGAWVPVFVNITNQVPSSGSLTDAQDFKGQLMVIAAPQDSRQDAIRFVRLVDVPKASSKRFVVYVKLAEKIPTGTIRLLLNSENGKFLTEYPVDISVVAKDKLLLVGVSEGARLPRLPRFRDQAFDTFLEAGIASGSLPDHWAGFDSADVVVFPAWPGKGVREESLLALREWVQMGGTLVFLTGKGTQTYADDTARGILPVEIKSTARLEEAGGRFRVSHDSSGAKDGDTAYIICEAEAKPGTETLLENGGVPLVVRQRLGLGQVVFFANDLESADTRLESLLGSAWQAIAPVPDQLDPKYELPDALSNLKTLTGRAARPPNTFLIILICVVYTIVVGPLNFGLLGRKKKLEWAWLTVPAIVLVFFFLIYGLGRLTKGSSNIIREVQIERFPAGSALGSSTTVTGTFVSNPGKHFFRPTGERQSIADSYNWNTTEEFRITDYTTALGIGSGSGSTSAGSSAPVISYEGRYGHLYLSSFDMGTYDARTFVGHGPVKAPGTIDSNLTWEYGYLNGTLTNNTGSDFSEAWLTVGTEALKIGALKQGESFTVDKQSILRAYTKLDPALNFANARPYLPTPDLFASLQMDKPNTDEEVNRSNFGLLMMASHHPKITGPCIPAHSGDVFFIGYRTAGEIRSLNTSIDADIKSSATATVVELPVAPRPGTRFVVPNDLLKVRMMSYVEIKQGRGFQFNNSQIELLDTSIVFCVELPFEHPGLRVTSLRVVPAVKALESQDMSVDVYRAGPSPGWQPVFGESEFVNQDMALPVTGRLYVRLTSQEKKTQSNLQLAWNARSLLYNLGITMKGEIAGPAAP